MCAPVSLKSIGCKHTFAFSQNAACRHVQTILFVCGFLMQTTAEIHRKKRHKPQCIFQYVTGFPLLVFLRQNFITCYLFAQVVHMVSIEPGPGSYSRSLEPVTVCQLSLPLSKFVTGNGYTK